VAGLTAVEPQGSTAIRHGETPLREGCCTRGYRHETRINTHGRCGHVIAGCRKSGLGDSVVPILELERDSVANISSHISGGVRLGAILTNDHGDVLWLLS